MRYLRSKCDLKKLLEIIISVDLLIKKTNIDYLCSKS